MHNNTKLTLKAKARFRYSLMKTLQSLKHRYDARPLTNNRLQYNNFVPYLCQLVFTAILWVKL